MKPKLYIVRLTQPFKLPPDRVRDGLMAWHNEVQTFPRVQARLAAKKYSGHVIPIIVSAYYDAS